MCHGIGVSAERRVLGEDIMQGMNIVGAHIDSPRLDVKQMPLYEDSNLVFLKTHYYGGIKKYQWTAIPLAIHGVIFTKEGKKVEICIGEDENDPVLFISDLLIHLSKKQLQETLAEGITAEQLNVLVGNMKPATPDESDDKKKDKSKEDKKGDKASPVKENILKILNQKYGITEEDFRVAELEIVPAGKARNVGLDNSMIAGHGHDDRVCAYTTLKAMLEVSGTPAKTAVALFADNFGGFFFGSVRAYGDVVQPACCHSGGDAKGCQWFEQAFPQFHRCADVWVFRQPFIQSRAVGMVQHIHNVRAAHALRVV